MNKRKTFTGSIKGSDTYLFGVLNGGCATRANSTGNRAQRYWSLLALIAL